MIATAQQLLDAIGQIWEGALANESPYRLAVIAAVTVLVPCFCLVAALVAWLQTRRPRRYRQLVEPSSSVATEGSAQSDRANGSDEADATKAPGARQGACSARAPPSAKLLTHSLLKTVVAGFQGFFDHSCDSRKRLKLRALGP